jgi:hypothetical protein
MPANARCIVPDLAYRASPNAEAIANGCAPMLADKLAASGRVSKAWRQPKAMFARRRPDPENCEHAGAL